MIQANDTCERIIRILGRRGPSLPIHISRETGMSSLFISAFLSELNSEKKVRISNLKVGGSPLYFLPGQENMLENFLQYMHPKELEAFQVLKEKKLLKDDEQSPQIRVALRNLRDFAIGFEKDGRIFWKYAFASQEEAEKIQAEAENAPEIRAVSEEKLIEEKRAGEEAKEGNPITEKIEEKVIFEEKKPAKPGASRKQAKKEKKQEEKEKFNNPLVILEKPEIKEKPKSAFVEKAINELKGRYTIVEEKSYKAKEYNAIVQVKSELGPINLFTVARDKKKIADSDLKKVLSEAQAIPLPALFVHNGTLSRKAVEYSQKYFSILKVLKLTV